MPRTFSIYLDAVRFLAALTVVVAHFTFAQFTGGLFPSQDAASTEAVTVFFVLSGYVIAYVAYEKEKTLIEFAVSRCARIYSVAIPALFLTVAIDASMIAVGAGQNVPLYEYHNMWKYLPIFLTFTSEVGTLHISVLTDGSFWSLSYEVWYYVTFAAAFYLERWRRALALIFCLAMLGVPILLYFPVWLLGCAVYRLHQGSVLPQGLARFVAATSLLALLALRASGLDEALDGAVNDFFGGTLNEHLHNSMHFALHYLVGSIVAVNFYAVRYCNLRWFELPRVGQVITYAASFTFAIYLGHRPLMNFWVLVLHHNPHSLTSIAMLFVAVAASVFLFGLVTEHRKKEWRTLFHRLFERLGVATAHASRP